MPDAATVIMLVQMITVWIFAFVIKQTKICRISMVHEVENMPAVYKGILYAVMVEYPL